MKRLVKRRIIFMRCRGSPPGGITGGSWEARRRGGEEAETQGNKKPGSGEARRLEGLKSA